MQYVTSVVAAVALTSSITLAPMQASAAVNCINYEGAEVCQTELSPTIHRIGVMYDQDTWTVLDVTCTDKQWIIHSGDSAGFSQTEREEFALGYCEGFGSMFSF